jgi:hydrogenase-4 component F
VSWVFIALLSIPLVAVAVSCVATPRIASVATVGSGLAALGLSIALALAVRAGQITTALSGWLRMDSVSAVFLLAVALVYATGCVYSVGYLRADANRRSYAQFARRYFAYLNLFAWTMLLVPAASDFATLWMAVELTTIVSALMVALDHTDAALEASWKYILIASTGLGIALLAVILLYAAGTAVLGAAYIPRFDAYLHAAGGLPAEPVKLAFLLAVVGFGTKVGFVPLHTWLPDAHSEAPSPVSALLSGALLADAFYAILRFFQVSALAHHAAFASRVLIVFGVLSLFTAGLFVLRQRSYKRLLAYSSVEHMGVIALGVGFGAPLAVAGALFHVINHAAAKGLAFFGSGSILRRYDSKEVDSIRGAATILPLTGPMFLIAALALSGLPLSGVFRSEFQIVSGGLARPEYLAVALLVLFVNLAFFGVVWHVGRMVLSPMPSRPLAKRPESRSMVIAMGICLLVVIALGVHLPTALAELLTNASHTLAISTPGAPI